MELRKSYSLSESNLNQALINLNVEGESKSKGDRNFLIFCNSYGIPSLVKSGGIYICDGSKLFNRKISEAIIKCSIDNKYYMAEIEYDFSDILSLITDVSWVFKVFRKNRIMPVLSGIDFNKEGTEDFNESKCNVSLLFDSDDNERIDELMKLVIEEI